MKREFRSSFSVLVKIYYLLLNVLARMISSLQYMTENFFHCYWRQWINFALNYVQEFRACIALYYSLMNECYPH